MKVRELGRYIRDQRSSLSLSLRSFSGLTGVSIPYLSQIERGLRRPSADILNAIAKALRISSETLYVKAGILDERVNDSDPVGEIIRDTAINERQKRILIDLYQSFREQEAAVSKATRRAGSSRAVAERRVTSKRRAPKGRATSKRPAGKKKARTSPASKVKRGTIKPRTRARKTSTRKK